DAAAAIEDAGRAEGLVRDQTGNIALVAKLFRGLILLHMGQLPEGARQLAESATIAKRTADDRPAVEYVIAAGLGMTWIGEHIAARELLVAVVRDLRGAGALGMLPFALCAVSRAEALAGNLGAARAMAAEAVELSRLTGDEFWRYLALSALAHVEAIRGAEESCRANAAEALALTREDTDYPRDATEALGLLELGLGRYDEAIAHFRAGVHVPAVTGAEEGHPDLVEAYIRSGRELTAHMAEIVDQLTRDTQFPLHAAVAWRLRGLVAGETDYPHCFEQALELHGQVSCPLETGRTHLSFGERLRRSGQRIRAREQLRRALGNFERLHAEPWADRTRNELTATGEAMRRRPGTSAVEELTPQEYQVARGVVEGSTNREVATALFLSAKTIEFHLGNVYRKLGVRSRTELAYRFPDLANR
ncbi:MAG TPA: LuxR C-terminal-related transcriptional regulator, partial [Actinophytocola sp.]|uniref:helix-turn-helix transcriptional regulator n=1 Tax=Actinophytocola sp. TaxID=1872138 RepID=UPI002E013D77|nr:LuxR C-terminal-related transcriptional regulator [Actinophytocola sp.]